MSSEAVPFDTYGKGLVFVFDLDQTLLDTDSLLEDYGTPLSLQGWIDHHDSGKPTQWDRYINLQAIPLLCLLYIERYFSSNSKVAAIIILSNNGHDGFVARAAAAIHQMVLNALPEDYRRMIIDHLSYPLFHAVVSRCHPFRNPPIPCEETEKTFNMVVQVVSHIGVFGLTEGDGRVFFFDDSIFHPLGRVLTREPSISSYVTETKEIIPMHPENRFFNVRPNYQIPLGYRNPGYFIGIHPKVGRGSGSRIWSDAWNILVKEMKFSVPSGLVLDMLVPAKFNKQAAVIPPFHEPVAVRSPPPPPSRPFTASNIYSSAGLLGGGRTRKQRGGRNRF